MKIREVVVNNRKAAIELVVPGGRIYPIPYSKLDPRPTARNRIREAYVDKDLGREAVTYLLESGHEGTVHIDHALEYNRDPRYLAELLSHKLTVEARRRAANAGLSRRELARRLNTSVPQIYRLLDPSNTRKNLGQLVELLGVLDCTVDAVITPRRAA
jgi:Cro/C1-type HTH DNA-binding domain